MSEKKIDKTTPKAYRDLLGNEVTWLKRKGFIAAIHPQVGITVKPKNPKDNGREEFLYCFIYANALRFYGKKMADKIFQARIKFLRTHSTLKDKDLITMDTECGVANPRGATFGGECPFS